MHFYLTPPLEMVEDDMIALQGLQARGWRVEAEHSRESTGDFCRRMKICHHTLSRRLADPRCPAVETVFSEGGDRLVAIYSNPVFETFIRSFRRP